MASKKISGKSGKPRPVPHYVGVILEDFNSKFKQITESFTTLATKEDLNRVENRIERVESDLQIVKRVLADKADRKDIETLTAKIDAVDAKLTAKIDAVDAKLTAKIDAVDAKLTAKIDAVDAKLTAKIDAVDAKLTAKIDAVDAKLTRRIDGQDAKMDTLATKEDIGEVKAILTNHETRISRLEQSSAA